MYKSRYYALQRADFLESNLNILATVRKDADGNYRVYIDTTNLIFGVDAMASDYESEKKIISHFDLSSLEDFYKGVIINGN